MTFAEVSLLQSYTQSPVYDREAQDGSSLKVPSSFSAVSTNEPGVICRHCETRDHASPMQHVSVLERTVMASLTEPIKQSRCKCVVGKKKVFIYFALPT